MVYFLPIFLAGSMFGWWRLRGAGLCGPNKSRWRLSGSQQQVFDSSDSKQQLRSLHNTAGLLEVALSPAWRYRCFVPTLPYKLVCSQTNQMRSRTCGGVFYGRDVKRTTDDCITSVCKETLLDSTWRFWIINPFYQYDIMVPDHCIEPPAW